MMMSASIMDIFQLCLGKFARIFGNHYAAALVATYALTTAFIQLFLALLMVASDQAQGLANAVHLPTSAYLIIYVILYGARLVASFLLFRGAKCRWLPETVVFLIVLAFNVIFQLLVLVCIYSFPGGVDNNIIADDYFIASTGNSSTGYRSATLEKLVRGRQRVHALHLAAITVIDVFCLICIVMFIFDLHNGKFKRRRSADRDDNRDITLSSSETLDDIEEEDEDDEEPTVTTISIGKDGKKSKK